MKRNTGSKAPRKTASTSDASRCVGDRYVVLTAKARGTWSSARQERNFELEGEIQRTKDYPGFTLLFTRTRWESNAIADLTQDDFYTDIAFERPEELDVFISTLVALRETAKEGKLFAGLKG